MSNTLSDLIEWWSFRGLDGSVAMTPVGTTREAAAALRGRVAVVDPGHLPLVVCRVTPWVEEAA